MFSILAHEISEKFLTTKSRKSKLHKRHFILTSGRCGSNYLANTLNLNAEVVNYGEVLGHWTLLKKVHKPLFSLGGLSKERYLDMLYRQSTYFYLAQCYSAYSHLRKKQPVNWKSRYDTQTIGIKDFFVNVKQDNLYNYFLDSKEISIIHLKRSNILKRLISAMLMHQVGVVSTTENSTENKSFEIDIEQLLAKLKRDYELNVEENAFVAKLSKKQPFYQLSYEDYFSSPESTSKHNSQIFDFLGVESTQVKSKHRKVLSQNLADIITNYDDIERALKATKFEQYLY